MYPKEDQNEGSQIIKNFLMGKRKLLAMLVTLLIIQTDLGIIRISFFFQSS